MINPLNTELNPICHLLALLGAHHILHVSRVRVKPPSMKTYLTLSTILDENGDLNTPATLPPVPIDKRLG
jgi:hypothetical protein